MIGQSISHYTIIEKLGEGGMGVVYKAQDTRLDRFVALKFLPAHVSVNEEAKARFLQEARAAAALNHAHICTIHGVEEDGTQMFIVMEYLDGGTLREKIPFSTINTAVAAAIQIAEALQDAHTNGIVHRDIKAENIMLTSKSQVKVMDFGLAKLKGSLKLTRTSSTVGTLAYMAPEQIQGGDVDSRSDIFSFGVLLFEMVTGKTPFRGEHEAAMMYSILNEEPFSTEQFRPDVPPVLTNVIQRCIEKDPADRYQTAGEIVIELRRVLKQSSKVHRISMMHAAAGNDEQRSQARPSEPVTAFPAVSSAGVLKKFLWPGIGIFAVAAALLVYTFVVNPSHPQQFQQMKITRLTNSGKVTQAVVSPDGRYIVYAQEDAGRMSLWMRQTATTSNVQVVPPSNARYGKLLFSHDGNFVYVLKAEKEGELAHLYSMPALGGSMKKLIHNINTFTVSPDDKQIAFVRYTIGDATFDLKSAGIDGTGERSIGQLKAPHSYDAIAWSPDGRTITCALTDVNSVSIMSVPVEGGSPKMISKHEWSTISSMEWLQDGSGIVVVPRDLVSSSGAQIWRIAYPSGETRRITNDINNYTSLSLTADSKSLVTTETEYNSSVCLLPAFGAGKMGWNTDQAKVMTSGKDDGSLGVALVPDGRIVYASSASGISQIWIMDHDGTNLHQLTSGDVPAANPVVSPDGRYILYLRAEKGSLDIWRMDLDGTNSLQLTRGEYSFTPDCTPDSKWVVYSRVKDGKYNLWKVPLDGGVSVQITQKHSHTVAVSPDGKSLVCEYQEKETGTSHSLVVIALENGAMLQTFERQEYGRFEWLPDGRTLGVIETRDGIPNLWTLPLDGSKAQQLTHFKNNKIFEFSWSHDGKTLVIARGPVVSDVILINNFQ
ncbi:MAG: protein kinase [Ignavibacteriales bacterium]|nr:protein kinase [Ignavibacteriales bacterium]